MSRILTFTKGSLVLISMVLVLYLWAIYACGLFWCELIMSMGRDNKR